MNYDVAVGLLEQVPTLYSVNICKQKLCGSKANKKIKLSSVQDIAPESAALKEAHVYR